MQFFVVVFFFAEIRKEDGDEYEPDSGRRMSDSRSYKARSDTLFTTFIDRCKISPCQVTGLRDGDISKIFCRID